MELLFNLSEKSTYFSFFDELNDIYSYPNWAANTYLYSTPPWPESLPPQFSGENKTLPLKTFFPCFMFSVEVNCYYSISYGSFSKYGLIFCSNQASTSLLQYNDHSNSFCLSNSNFKFCIWVRQKQNLLLNASKKYILSCNI